MSSDKRTESDPAGAAPAGAAGAASRGHHDWHSAEYVQGWIADYDSRLTDRQPQFDLLADLIPFPESAEFRFLDVGAEWGPVTRHLLHRLPHAHATLLDYSEPMLAEARARLAGAEPPAAAGRVEFVQGDLAHPGAVAAALRAAGGRFGAVISSLCVHNLRPAERIAALYGEIAVATAPGGRFLNLDLIGAAGTPVQDAWRRTRIQQLRRERQAQTCTLPSFDEIEQALHAHQEARRAAAHGQGPAAAADAQLLHNASGAGREPLAGPSRTLLDHLMWLKAAGFDGVECFWRQERQALIGGFLG